MNGMHLKRFYPPPDKEPVNKESAPTDEEPTPPADEQPTLPADKDPTPPADQSYYLVNKGRDDGYQGGYIK